MNKTLIEIITHKSWYGELVSIHLSIYTSRSMNNVHLELYFLASISTSPDWCQTNCKSCCFLPQNRSVRQFLLTNLVEQNGHYAWRVNLEAISASLDHIMSFPSFNNTYEGPTLFLGGASSAYIRYSSADTYQFTVKVIKLVIGSFSINSEHVFLSM